MAGWQTVLFTVLNCLSMIIGSFANLLVIVSSLLFISVTEIEGTSLFLVSLSVADFLVCAVYQPLLVLRFNHPDQNRAYSLSQYFFGFSLMTASINGLLAVTIDRFVAIYLPFKYIYWINEKNVAVLISLSWLVALAIGIINLSTNLVVKVIVCFYVAMTIVLVLLCYGVIYKEARKQARRIMDQSMPEAQNAPNRRRVPYKATRGVGLVLVTTVSCWLPVILYPAAFAANMSDEEMARANYWCVTAACVSSCINPFIYVYNFSKFRRNIKKMFRSIQQYFGAFFPIRVNRHKVNPASHLSKQVETTGGRAWVTNDHEAVSAGM